MNKLLGFILIFTLMFQMTFAGSITSAIGGIVGKIAGVVGKICSVISVAAALIPPARNNRERSNTLSELL